eukprot:gb/GECG01015671.1/.p1 GENE.gb/GECG01015671.1/~~gb/GECG01015671.1/.p1  ORF type:complete len:217 (+),score=37.42 gb/GECG01015671.1/:1-651(+)
MGNKHGKGALKERDLREYQSMCQLERDEIEMLYAQFMAMRASDTNDVLINQTEFQRALGFSDGQSSLFVERIFHLFDENGDGYVNFPEFIRGFSKLTPHGTHEQKLNFTFNIYDSNGDGKISSEDLRRLLQGCLDENGLHFAPSDVQKMVESTFEQVDQNRDGYIDFEEYRAMVDRNPYILQPLVVNISELIQEFRALESQNNTSSGKSGGRASLK